MIDDQPFKPGAAGRRRARRAVGRGGRIHHHRTAALHRDASSACLTDLSLLELGDVAHPLLQELVRRAPSTYNHSITVGSIAEAAAESIHARGLLVRVGAYFHDIGKMLKPDYFVENQGARRQPPRGAACPP